MKQYFVSICLDCNKPVVLMAEVMDMEHKCCLDLTNHKVIKIFNDETEALNYTNILKNEN